MKLENDDLKINSEKMFQNNLKLLRQHKIPHINALQKISGLSALCRIFNQSILESGNNSILANGHYCVKLSMSDVYEKMSKRTQKKYLQNQKGIATINKNLLRHDIRLLIIAEVIRKVDFADLTPQEQAIIASEKKEFYEGKTTYDVYTSVPFYEVLDLRHSHLERLTKIKNKDISSYPIVQQMFGDQIANNCFNRTVRDYKIGLNTSSKNSFKHIVDVIKKNRVISVKDLAEYCAQNFSLSNGKYKTPKWWYKQLRGFNFKRYNIMLCKNNKLGKRKQLPIYGGMLVFYYHKKKDTKLGGISYEL